MTFEDSQHHMAPQIGNVLACSLLPSCAKKCLEIADFEDRKEVEGVDEQK